MNEPIDEQSTTTKRRDNEPPAAKKDTRLLTFAAADAMLQAGDARSINVRSIMAAINYGSAGTVNNALKEWWQQLGERLNEQNNAVDTLRELPEALRQNLLDVINAITQHAQQTEYAHYEATIQQAEDVVKKANAESELAEQARSETAKAAFITEEKNNELRERIALLTQYVETEQARAEKALSDKHNISQLLAKSQEDIVALEEKIKISDDRYTAMQSRLMQQYDDEKLAHKKWEMLAESHAHTLSQKEAELQEKQVEQAKVIIELESANQAIAKLETQLCDSDIDRNQLSSLLKDSQTNNTKITTELNILKEQLSVLQLELKTQSSQQLNQEIELREIQRKVDSLTSENQKLRKQLKEKTQD